MDDQNRTPDTPAEEQAEITFDGQDTGITVKDALGPAAPMIEKIMQEHIARVTETIAALAPTFKAIQERTDESIASLQAFFDSDKWQEMRQKLEEVLELADETEELSPYLEEELKKPEYEGKTIDELLHVAERDEDSTPIEESLYVRALAAARAARDAAKQRPERVTIKRADKVDYPLDKLNSYIWGLLEKDTRGQIAFNMAGDKDKRKGLELPTYYAIKFDDLTDDVKITKRLLPFDKLAYIATGALYNAGNSIITPSQIYYAMGYTGRPGTKDLEKINTSLTKMRAAEIYIDNEQEAAKYKYDLFQYDGSLLPMERITGIINGQVTDAAIHVFREPPLLTFARQRKQITTINVKLLQAPISKTDANLQIQDYLIERISEAKNKKGKTHSCNIKFETLYNRTNITERKQQQRTPDKVRKYLSHFKEEGYITNFKMQKDKVTVFWG